MSAFSEELGVALGAVTAACRLCETVRADDGHRRALAKDDRSPVTVADFGSQALIAAAIRAAFAQDAIVAEEDAAMLREPDSATTRGEVVAHVQAVRPGMGEPAILTAIDSGQGTGGRGRFWTIDPIDGTKGFVRGEQYAVALALLIDGTVQLGVLGCPHLPVDPAQPDGPRGALFWAVRGQGAWCRALGSDDAIIGTSLAHEDPHPPPPLPEGGERPAPPPRGRGRGGRSLNTATQPVRVAGTDDPAEAAFCESVESGHSAHGTSAKVADKLGVRAAPVRMDSQCKYATVARGAAAVYLRVPTKATYQEKIWDHAAGAILVEEAGGRVSDVRGQPLDFSIGRQFTHNVGVVATNGRLHDRVLAAISAVLGTE